MKPLVLGRSAGGTLVPYPTLDALVQLFDGQHVGLGDFKIRVSGQDVYLDREDESTAQSFGPWLGQKQRRIYSVSLGADAFVGLLSTAVPELVFDVRECQGTSTEFGKAAAEERLSGHAGCSDVH